MKVFLVFAAMVVFASAKPSSNLQALLKKALSISDDPDVSVKPVDPTVEPVDPTVEPVDPTVKPLDPNNCPNNPDIPPEEEERMKLVREMVKAFEDALREQVESMQITQEEYVQIKEEVERAFHWLSSSEHFELSPLNTLDLNEGKLRIECTLGKYQYFLERVNQKIRPETNFTAFPPQKQLDNLRYFLEVVRDFGRHSGDIMMMTVAAFFRISVYGYNADQVCPPHLEQPGCFTKFGGDALKQIGEVFNVTYSNPFCNRLVGFIIGTNEGTYEESFKADLQCLIGETIEVRSYLREIDEFRAEQNVEEVMGMLYTVISKILLLHANTESALSPLYHIEEELSLSLHAQADGTMTKRVFRAGQKEMSKVAKALNLVNNKK